MLRAEQQPARIVQRGCCGVLVVVHHEPVELLDRDGGLLDMGRRERQADRRAAAGPHRLIGWADDDRSRSPGLYTRDLVTLIDSGSDISVAAVRPAALLNPQHPASTRTTRQ